MSRRVLVTGGAGFIGSRISELLLERGDEVVVVDDLSTGRRDRVPEGARLEVADVRDGGALERALPGVSVVFHLAARVSIRGSVEGFREDHDINLGGTLALLDAIRDTSVSRLVYASSMAVYADAPEGRPITETHPTVPLSPYGVSKLAAEHYCRVMATDLGIEQLSLRYFNTWGPGQALSAYVGVATIFINALLEGQRPTIFGDGKQTRDFIHVDDVARATVAAGEVGITDAVLNVGTGRGTSVETLLEMIADEIGAEATAERVPARSEELAYSVADTTRALAALGLEAEVALDVGPLVAHWRRELSRRPG